MPAVAERHRAELDPMLPRMHGITQVRRESHDTFTLEIDVPGGYRFQPGQFNMLYAPGVGEVPISISSDPDGDGPLQHTTRAVGPVTRALQRLRAGDVIGLRGPFGTAWPLAGLHGRDVVLVAGGIGLPPLRPALYRMLAHRERQGRIVLLYGARTPRDILYTHELERWRARFDMDVEVTVDSAPGEWRGNVGVVTSLIPRLSLDPRDAVAMICGPEVMMRFAVAGLTGRGFDAANVWLSMERNMKCAVGVCGHCQLGPFMVCRDGAVFRLSQVRDLLGIREL